MNNFKSQLEYVKQNVNIKKYAEHTLTHAKQPRGSYVCPACNSGGHNSPSSDSALIIDEKNQHFHCFACGKDGDIFDLAGIVNNTDEVTEKLQIVADYAGIRLGMEMNQRTNYRPTQTASPSHGAKSNAKANATDAQKLTANRDKERSKMEQWQKDIQNEEINAPAVAYLKKRGFTLTDAVNHGVGYDKDRRRVIIPCKGNNFYHFDRAITDDTKIKHMKPKSDEVGAQPLYNSKALKEKCVLIVEGEFDALTLHVLGFDNVIMTGGGTACLQDVTERIKDQPVKPLFVLLFDTDEKGVQFSTDAVAALERVGAVAKDASKDIFTHGKDANEEFTADRDALKSNLTAYCAKALQTLEQDKKEAYRRTLERYNIVSLANSHRRIYTQEGISEPIRTGFNLLDKKLNGGLHAKQLITIGAISSCGKTSLCLQIAHNIAYQGLPALFVSIEQSAFELDAKLISMYTDVMEFESMVGIPYKELLHKDTSRLTNNKLQEQIRNAYENLDNNIQNRLHIMECESQPTVEKIREIVRHLAEHEQQTPVVIVDYLQLLAPANEREERRQGVDNNLTALKQLARDYNTPVVVISSINRGSYKGSVQFESFKESGNIEFSSDVVLGIEPRGLKAYEESIKEDETKRKRACKKFIEESKDKDVAELEVLILKNRNGKTDENEGTTLTFNKPCSHFNEFMRKLTYKQDIQAF